MLSPARRHRLQALAAKAAANAERLCCTNLSVKGFSAI